MHLADKDIFRFKIKVSHANGNQKRTRIAILTSDRTDFIPKTVKKRKTEEVIR